MAKSEKVAAEKTPDSDDPSAGLGGRRDRLITGMLATAAILSVMTLGVLATRFAGGEPTQTNDLLRLASAQFVEGEWIVAGKLAETIDLGPRDPLPPDEFSDGDQTAAPPPTTDDGVADDGMASEDESVSFVAGRESPRVLRDFLVGMGKSAQADLATDSRQQKQLRVEAVEALGWSALSGFPPGREGIGHRVLGQLLVDIGRYREAREPLAEAIRLNPTLSRELSPIYANALRRGESSRPEEAMTVMTQYLNIPTLSVTERAEGQIIEMQILASQKRYEFLAKRIADLRQPPTNADSIADQQERQRVLAIADLTEATALVRQMADRMGIDSIDAHLRQPPDQIPTATSSFGDDPETLRIAKAAGQKLSEVIRTASPSVAATARLWLARLYRLVGDNDRALTHLTEARQQRPLAAVGIQAGLEEVELLGRTGAGEELVQTVRYLVREIEDPLGYDAAEVPLDEFRQRTMRAIGDLHVFGQFEPAIEASLALPPLFSEADSLISQGRAYAAWAAATENVGVGAKVDRQTSASARERYRLAGQAFSDAAERSFGSPNYVDVQWSAIDAYQKGRHFTQSIRHLGPYLRYEDRRRSSRGLLAMGRAMLAEGRVEEAIEPLRTCMVEQPRDPLRYDARLWIAKAYRELRQPDEAKRYLLDNLRDGSLTPQSPAWRESLFALGQTLHGEAVRPLLPQKKFDADELPPGDRRGDHRRLMDQTFRYLDEAVQRYWPSPDSLAAMYASAQTDLAAAKLAGIEADEADTLEAAKRNFLGRRDAHLQSAAQKLRRLSDHLIALEDDHRLSDAQSGMLRNALMLRGDLLRQSRRYEEAIEAYRTVEQRHVHTPTSLEAIMRRRESLRQLGRREEADLLVQQALASLQRIDPSMNDQFAKVSRYDRRGWEDYLGWLNEQASGQT